MQVGKWFNYMRLLPNAPLKSRAATNVDLFVIMFGIESKCDNILSCPTLYAVGSRVSKRGWLDARRLHE